MQNHAVMPEPKPGAPVRTRGAGRPKWHRLYYLLAAFDVLTVALTLILNHQTRDVFARSVEVNHVWSQRRTEFAALDDLTDDVDEPGDHVLVSLDPAAELARMRAARSAFDQRLVALRDEIRANANPAEAAHFLDDFGTVAAAMDDMTAEGELVLSYFAQGQPDEGSRRIPVLDLKHGKVSSALASMRREVTAIQDDNLARQEATANSVANFEYVIAAAILLMIAAATLYGRKLAQGVEADACERERLYGALAERERQLHELVGRLIHAQEEERRRVAYNLHDGLAQTAAGAHLHLRSFARRYKSTMPGAREELDRALMLAQQVVREARTVVAELRPTALDDLGLEAALEAEVEELQKAGWRVEFEVEIGPKRLDPLVETALFRVAQEALRNACKHAQTRRARVSLRRTERAVRLEVQDWGRGFEPAAVPARGGPGERVGLSGMRERVALLDGRCEVESRPGEGTRIVAEVPLPAPGAPVDAVASAAR